MSRCNRGSSSLSIHQHLRRLGKEMDSCEEGSAHIRCYEPQGPLHGFSYLKENRFTHLQVVHPVFTLGALLLGRLTLACLVGSLSDLSPAETSLSTRLMGSSLGSITDAITNPCTENGGVMEKYEEENNIREDQ